MCAYWSYHSFDIILMLPWNIKKSIPTVRCIQTVIQCYSVKINTSLIMMRECPYIVQTAHSSGQWVVVHFELCSEQLVAGAGGQRWDAIKKSGAHSMQGQMHAPLMRKVKDNASIVFKAIFYPAKEINWNKKVDTEKRTPSSYMSSLIMA